MNPPDFIWSIVKISGGYNALDSATVVSSMAVVCNIVVSEIEIIAAAVVLDELDASGVDIVVKFCSLISRRERLEQVDLSSGFSFALGYKVLLVPK